MDDVESLMAMASDPNRGKHRRRLSRPRRPRVTSAPRALSLLWWLSKATRPGHSTRFNTLPQSSSSHKNTSAPLLPPGPRQFSAKPACIAAMAIDIELDDLSRHRNADHSDHTAETEDHPDSREYPKDDGVIAAWAWASAIILLILAAPLTLSPRLLLFLSETGAERRVSLTSLESFIALHTGVLLFAVALSLIFNIPSDPMDLTARRGAPGHPLLEPLSGACLITAFIAYNTASVGPLSLLVSFGSGTIGLWGLWAILFAGSSSISRKTGADKRTSRFLFGNRAAASAQKKLWKKEQAPQSRNL
ncbi:hypothetical protein C8Q79DRAFT_603012 [Trametes meyenii]|nr:hypothetical protein C8Q79DRAFT_603012 [Trametes meyenii]